MASRVVTRTRKARGSLTSEGFTPYLLTTQTGTYPLPRRRIGPPKRDMVTSGSQILWWCCYPGYVLLCVAVISHQSSWLVTDKILCPEVVLNILNYYGLYSTNPPACWVLGSSEPPNSPDSRVRLS